MRVRLVWTALQVVLVVREIISVPVVIAITTITTL